MAPEQAHRQAITPKTDIYNFGATMYWVLVGEVVPTAMPPQDDKESLYTGAVDAKLVRPPLPPHERDSSIHPLLSKQILDCVRLHPEERPGSMAVVANRLELIGELLKNPGKPPPPISGDQDTQF
jgi:serine/threonine-protein kinase